MKLPVPETRYSWLASVLVIITAFALYYGGAYRLFFNYYKNQYVEAQIPNFTVLCGTSDEDFYEEITATPTVDFPSPTPSPTYEPVPTSTLLATDGDAIENENACGEQKWSLILQIPLYVSYATPGWIYFELRNENTVPQDAALVINFSGEKLSLLPSMYHNETYIRALKQEQIAAGATLYGRIYFGGNQIPDKDECDRQIKNAFFINGYMIDIQAEDNVTCPQNDIRKSFWRSIVENLLLPPWANTLIPAISLFICFLFDAPTNDHGSKMTDKNGSDDDNSEKADQPRNKSINKNSEKADQPQNGSKSNSDKNSKLVKNDRDKKEDDILFFTVNLLKVYTFSMETIVLVGLLMVALLLGSLENSKNLVPDETVSAVILLATGLLFAHGSMLLLDNRDVLQDLFKRYNEICPTINNTKLGSRLQEFRKKKV